MAEEKKKVCVGDAVVVKDLPNSPVMSIVDIDYYGPPGVHCVWFTGDRGNEYLSQAKFALECLEPAEDRIKADEEYMRERMELMIDGSNLREKLMLGRENRITLLTSDESESES